MFCLQDKNKSQPNSAQSTISSTSNLAAPSRPSGGKLSPPLPTKPKPLSRTSSAGVTRVTDAVDVCKMAPTPAQKPALKLEKHAAPVTLPKPEPRQRPPKIEEPVSHPRRMKENPRPASPTHLPLAAPPDVHYSTPKPAPRGESSATKNMIGSQDKEANVSANSSILDTVRACYRFLVVSFSSIPFLLLSVCHIVSLSLSLFSSLLCFSLSLSLSLCFSVCLSLVLCLSLCLSVCLSLCLSLSVSVSFSFSSLLFTSLHFI